MDFYNLTNVVAAAVLSDRIDFESLLKIYPEAIRLNKFHAYKIKVRDGILIIFNNAKLNATGYKSVRGIEEAVEEFAAKTLTSIKSLRIVNLSACSKLQKPIDYQHIIKEEKVQYEPDLFPGIYFIYNKAKIILFHTGKYILTGFTSVSELEKYHDLFLKTIYSPSLEQC